MQAISQLYLPENESGLGALRDVRGDDVTLGWFFILGRAIVVGMVADAVIHERFGRITNFVFSWPIVRSCAAAAGAAHLRSRGGDRSVIAVWLRHVKPDRQTLKQDVVAGLPGAISSVPDGMAASVLAGVNPVWALPAGSARSPGDSRRTPG